MQNGGGDFLYAAIIFLVLAFTPDMARGWEWVRRKVERWQAGTSEVKNV